MNKLTWKLKEPGHLVADGTQFAVKYMPADDPDKPYVALQDNRVVGRWGSLHIAKTQCENLHRDLVEIGVT